MANDGQNARRELEELIEDFRATPYRLGRPLAQGGMGSVFEAEHAELRRPVVIKLILPALSKLPQLVERLAIEGRVLASMQHENLVKVTDLSVTPGGRAYIAMELLSGSTLRAVLEQRGPLPPLEAIDFCVQILRGLEVAHRAQVVHRDVKLDNLFVCDPDDKGRRVLKVLDFGIAKVLSETLRKDAKYPTAEGTIVGTPMFMSPEQARAQPVDARSDIYSVGVVLFRCITGQLPFSPPATLNRERAFIEMLKQHVETPPPVPSRVASQPIPPELDAAILRALAKRPEDRFQSAGAFADALAELARRAAAGPPSSTRRLVPSGTEPMPRATPAPDLTAADAALTRAIVPAPRGPRSPRPRRASPIVYGAVLLASAVVFTFILLRVAAWIVAR